MKSIQSVFVIVSCAFIAIAQQTQNLYGQCGGLHWHGPFTCEVGTTCVLKHEYYSQCLPAPASSFITMVKPSTTTALRSITAPTLSITRTTPLISSKVLSTTIQTLTTITRASAPATPTNSGRNSGRTRFAGVNMAGFDFGMDIYGGQNFAEILTPENAQMAHFFNDNGMNIFRLPAGWQFLLNNVLGGTLNPANFARYDNLVQGCLATGAYCILDIHNYARWNGAIVGQGGPTDFQLADVWRQLAEKYASQSRIIFGIMNEPHDVPSTPIWAQTVQVSVNAIRRAGALTQMILLPGNGWAGAGNLVSSGSLAALSAITNLDGSKTNLVFDIHKYLDFDESGKHFDCVTNNVAEAFAPLAIALRETGRQALLTETGGGNTESCVRLMCEQLGFVNANADVFLGYVGWSAGAFQPSWNYELTLVPTWNGNTWIDTWLMNSCFKR